MSMATNPPPRQDIAKRAEAIRREAELVRNLPDDLRSFARNTTGYVAKMMERAAKQIEWLRSEKGR